MLPGNMFCGLKQFTYIHVYTKIWGHGIAWGFLSIEMLLKSQIIYMKLCLTQFPQKGL